MNITKELLKLKKTLTKNIQNNNDSINIDLNDKINEFINWYYDNMVKHQYSDIGEFSKLKKMRNLIEKVAVWYELRYPDYEINKKIYCCGQEDIDINNIMFKDLDTNLKWEDFYNANNFIKSLPWEERIYFSKPKYDEIVYLNSEVRSAHLHLTKNGYVEMAEDIASYTNFTIKDEDLEGLHIKKVLELFKEKGIILSENNQLERTIRYVDKWNYQKEEMLNCIMYRIIERGGNRIGPRRAFLFAKEFNRNIDIPMMYGVDLSDPGLREFINKYLKSGGSKELECYLGYFSRTSKEDRIKKISVEQLLLSSSYKLAYTPEENHLHQELVNVISSQIDKEKVKQEKIKQLRIERKINKNKKA